MASSTLFVSNFPFMTTEDDLRAAFEEHGAVGSVRIIMDRDTGRSRGFAFVELADDAVDAAIAALNNSDFRGRRLIVSPARGRAPSGPGQNQSGRAATSEGASRPTPPFRYRIVIEWDDAEKSYAASVPTVGVRAQAATVEGAARQARILAQERLDQSSDESPPADT